MVRAEGVEFSGHPGPALYFRRPGSYEVLDCVIEDSAWAEGVLPVPGAVVAVEGVSAWQPATEDSGSFGLLLADTLVSQVPTHAILLDSSSATVEGLSFDGVEGFELYQQRCDEALGLAEVVGGELLSNECEGSSNVVEPMLWWTVELGPLGL